MNSYSVGYDRIAIDDNGTAQEDAVTQWSDAYVISNTNNSGRFDTEDITNDQQLCEILRFYKKRALGLLWFMRHVTGTVTSNMPPVCIDFVKEEDLNAFAFWDGDQGGIGINVGTIKILRSLFLTLLSHPLVLPDIGQTSVETAPPIVAADFLSRFSDSNYDVAPNDAVRLDCALLLTQIAIDFLVAHEFAHLRNGHVRLFAELSGAARMVEIGWDRNAGVTPMISQACEMDADAYAMNHAAIRLFRRIRICTHQVVNDLKLEKEGLIFIPFDPSSYGFDVYPMQFYKDELQSAELVSFAIYCLFRIIEHEEINYSSLHLDDHPTPPLRQYLSRDTFGAWISANIGEEMNRKVGPSYISGVIKAEEALHRISQEYSIETLKNRLFLINAMSGEDNLLRQHSFDAYDTWREIHPDLQKVAYATNLPLCDYGLSRRRRKSSSARLFTTTYVPRRKIPKKQGRRR